MTEEKEKWFKGELEEIDSELHLLKEEDEALTKGLKEVEECHDGALRSLFSMQTQLEGNDK